MSKKKKEHWMDKYEVPEQKPTPQIERPAKLEPQRSYKKVEKEVKEPKKFKRVFKFEELAKSREPEKEKTVEERLKELEQEIYFLKASVFRKKEKI